MADAADGENVLVVSHMDAVSASVSRYMPWAVVYPVKHTGFTVSYREKYAGAVITRGSCYPRSRDILVPMIPGCGNEC